MVLCQHGSGVEGDAQALRIEPGVFADVEGAKRSLDGDVLALLGLGCGYVDVASQIDAAGDDGYYGCQDQDTEDEEEASYDAASLGVIGHDVLLFRGYDGAR